jgi:hypothetical protein
MRSTLIGAVLLGMLTGTQKDTQPIVNQIGLELLPGEFLVCRLEKNAKVPDWAMTTTPSSISRSSAALSIIAPAHAVLKGTNCAGGWRMFEVGFNPPEAFGVVEAFARPLADQRISIHWISSSPTDYLMVEQQNLETAIRVLTAAGHQIRR